MKKWSILAVLAAMLCTLLAAGCGGGPQQNAASDGKNKLVIYTSMKESLIGGIVEGFKKKYPDIGGETERPHPRGRDLDE